jgi:HTH-type transcriptional regulator/antitoxin HigA
MNIRPIKTEQDYNTIAIVSAIERIEELWGSKKDTAAGDELDLLVTLVESYEMKHYPITPRESIDAIKFRMEQIGMSKDIW